MKNVRSAHVFDLKLLIKRNFIWCLQEPIVQHTNRLLVFGIYYKIHSIRELSIGEGKYHKNNLTYLGLG